LTSARTTIVLAACAAIGGVSLAACSVVLGFNSLTLETNAEGGPSPNEDGGEDGTSDGPGPNNDSGNDSGTCVADLMTDAKHCGRCNHSCLGSTCEAGQCQPLKLGDGLAIPLGLVVDATDVFVAEYDLNRIVKFGKNTLGPCQVAPLPDTCVFINDTNAEAFKPTAMGTDGTTIFWTSTGGGVAHEIRSCPRAGCGGQAAKLVAQLGQDAFAHPSGGALPLELIVKDGQVFWPESNGSAIRSTPVAGGGAVTTYLQDNNFMPVAIAVDATQIYFTDDTRQHQAQVAAVPRDGTKTVRVIASTPAPPYGIGQTPANLYWTVPFDGGEGLIQASPKTADGGAPVGAFASQQDNPKAMIVDAANVYWLVPGANNAATGQVLYCPLATGCPSSGPIVLANYQRYPARITQDETAIYWSNEGLSSSSVYDGQVWKVAKP
jgi:hypothetical protein